MITQLKDGLNEIITENGKNISGGQRQRITLARALYHDFDLLILDEAFSEMDDAAEKDIIMKLKDMVLEDKMILLITHNISTLAHCDRVISLENAYV
jgi:ABC-type bacteriocin/lantibiotic exporter with double-glycine peptidase domain